MKYGIGDRVLVGSIRGRVEDVVSGAERPYGVRYENGNFRWCRAAEMSRLKGNPYDREGIYRASKAEREAFAREVEAFDRNQELRKVQQDRNWRAVDRERKGNPVVRTYMLPLSNWRTGFVPVAGDILTVAEGEYWLRRAGFDRRGRAKRAPRAYLPAGRYLVTYAGNHVRVSPVSYTESYALRGIA